MPRKAAEPPIFDLPVLPAADIFPMMDPDELAELADDIKANGLREPLVTAMVDGELVLVDGRNRRAACKKAGVTPEVRQLNGEDPTAFVMSANIHRRHMTKGQRAMAIAMVYPEPERGGRGKKSPITGEFKVNDTYLGYARTVAAYAPEMAQAIVNGSQSLDKAYRVALDRKREAGKTDAEDAKAAAEMQARLTKLRGRYADLADKVVEGELSLDDAEKEADNRDERRDLHIGGVMKAFFEAAHTLSEMPAPKTGPFLVELLAEQRHRIRLRNTAHRFGCFIAGEGFEEGFAIMQRVVDILAETAEQDPEVERIR